MDRLRHGSRPQQKRSRPAAAKRGRFWKYRRALFLLGLLLFSSFAGVGYVLVQVPLPAEVTEAQTTFLTDIRGRRLASLDAGENRVSVKIDAVPAVLVDAVLATEDKSFFKHGGVDPVGTGRALWSDVRNRNAAQGGSTITQQYVKNTYVGRERTVWRKVKEAAISVKLERKYDKREILERYLNSIYFGRGAYGVQAASQAYYGKDVGEINLQEAAYLAGLIRAPEAADVDRAAKEAVRRRDTALDAMQQSGFTTAKQVKQAKSIPLQDMVTSRADIEPSVAMGDKGTQYFVEAVRQELVRKYGEDTVLRGGLRVKTTLDLDMQADAYDAVYGFLKPNEPAGALVAVDNSGQVVAMVGGRDFSASKVNLAMGTSGGGTGRQAGSTFKPFLLAEVIRQGYSVESSFPAPGKIVLPRANAGRDYPVSNYDNEDLGRLNLIDATRNSVNTVYAQLQQEIGANDLINMSKSLGITSDLKPNASLVLGTSEVAVIDMAGAYSTFAARGVHSTPHLIAEVRTADGRLLDSGEADAKRVLDPEVADVVNFCLQQVVDRGTGAGAQYGGPLAGKTGTTQDYADAWFVGYSPKLTTAVWMGYPEGASRKMLNVRGRKVSGGSFPATIFKRFMSKAAPKSGGFREVTSFPGKTLGSSRLGFSTETTTSTLSTLPGDPAATTIAGPAPVPTTAPGASTPTTLGAVLTTVPPLKD